MTRGLTVVNSLRDIMIRDKGALSAFEALMPKAVALGWCIEIVRCVPSTGISWLPLCPPLAPVVFLPPYRAFLFTYPNLHIQVNLKIFCMVVFWHGMAWHDMA
jgi:hypothetical protein